MSKVLAVGLMRWSTCLFGNQVLPGMWKADIKAAFRRMPIKKAHTWAAAVTFKAAGKVCFVLKSFLVSSRWSRGTVKMEGFELAATLVATSDFQNFFLGPLRAPEDPQGKGKWLRDPWETPWPSSKQNHCISIRNYAAPCPRGL